VVGTFTVTTGACSSWSTRRTRGRGLYLATSGDLHLATSGDFFRLWRKFGDAGVARVAAGASRV